ncbi:MAG: AMP-binding protein [Desulfobacterales bacterium]|jgi:acyl-CoA synthetase (AMP-forming)/AMP-acid ligase II|nr:AMP-binding protein [Desulfobacterales bacterium]
MWIYPEIKTLADVPSYHAKHRGDNDVFLLEDRTVTYNELERESNRIANALIEKKIPRHSRIGFIGKNSEFYFYVLFGSIKAGRTFAPLNWRLSPAELSVIIQDAGAPIVFAEFEYIEIISKIKALSVYQFDVVYFNTGGGQLNGIEKWLEFSENNRPMVDINSEDTAIQLYTSGTTGKPKGVELSFRGIDYWFLLLDLEPTVNYSIEDVMLFIAPNFHMLGLMFAISALYNGTKLSIIPEVRADRMRRAIVRDHVSVLVLVPIMIELLLDASINEPADFSSLKTIIYAGAPIGLKLLQRALNEMKCDFMQLYGTTESGGGITLLRPEEHDLKNEAKLKSCGRPLPFVKIKVMDFNGKEVGFCQPGEFWLRTPLVFKKYYSKPELTAEVLKDGWYKTGDVGYCDHEGYYYIVDRTKDMIISGGENVYSIEVEQALQKHPAVQQVAVIGVPHEKWGEVVKALVILKEGETVTPDELKSHCRDLIGGYKIPKLFEFVAHFPTSPSGKVIKKLLREAQSGM